MTDIINDIQKRAAELQKHIIFPEADDERVIKAADYLREKKICNVTLVGDASALKSVLAHKSTDIIDTTKPLPHAAILAKRLWQRRKDKLKSWQEAEEFLKNRLNYASALIEAGYVDGGVAGSVASTGDVIRAAIRCIGLKEETNIVSSCFLMALSSQKAITYADCGVVPYPNAEQLADIAIESAETHQRLTGKKPIVAMLSFSTKGSAKHERVERVQKATKLANAKNPKLDIDGEFQFDAACVPGVAKRKAPDSAV